MYNLLFRCITGNGISKQCEERKQSEQNTMLILDNNIHAYLDGSLQDDFFMENSIFFLQTEWKQHQTYVIFYFIARSVLFCKTIRLLTTNYLVKSYPSTKCDRNSEILGDCYASFLFMESFGILATVQIRKFLPYGARNLWLMLCNLRQA